MQIDTNTVVTLNYVLTDDSGKELDRASDGKFVYLHGAQNIIPGLENALTGKQTGDALEVSITAEEGYGNHDESLIQTVSSDMFENTDDLAVGQQFHAQGADGQVIVITVTDVNGDQVTIDGNHPLAGVNLNFSVEVVGVRAASDEEISHGHVHGPGGHQH